jgi:hypothetical protein
MAMGEYPGRRGSSEIGAERGKLGRPSRPAATAFAPRPNNAITSAPPGTNFWSCHHLDIQVTPTIVGLVFSCTSSFLMAPLHWWEWWFVAYLMSLENKSLVVPGSSRTRHTVGSAKMTICECVAFFVFHTTSMTERSSLIPALEATTTGTHLNNINLFASSGVTY